MHADGFTAQKWFLVSGGSGGIGAAVCDLLAARGFEPVVAYHRNAAAAEAVAQRSGGRSLALDLSDEASILAASGAARNRAAAGRRGARGLAAVVAGALR